MRVASGLALAVALVFAVVNVWVFHNTVYRKIAESLDGRRITLRTL